MFTANFIDISRPVRLKILLLEALLMTTIMLICQAQTFYNIFTSNQSMPITPSYIAAFVGYLLVIAFYTISISQFGTTPIKSIFNVKVINASNEDKPKFYQVLLRLFFSMPILFYNSVLFILFHYRLLANEWILNNLKYLIYFGILICLIHLVLSIYRPNKPTLADILDGTRLVKINDYEIEHIGKE